jgi:transcriptional regulator with XRE-family HTH domain
MSTPENNPPSSQTGFGLPDDYFLSSAAALQNRMLWLEEHRDYPALKMAWRKEGWEVPGDYFHRLEQRLELLSHPTLQAMEKKNTFTLPDSDTVKENISSTLKISTLAPYANAFQIPEDYFLSSQTKLQAIKEADPVAKILNLPFRIFRFAAAAMLIFTATWWFYTKHSSVFPAQDCGGLACIDRTEIIKDKSFEMLEEEDLNLLVNPLALERSLDKQQVPLRDSLSAEEEFLENL